MVLNTLKSLYMPDILFVWPILWCCCVCPQHQSLKQSSRLTHISQYESVSRSVVMLFRDFDLPVLTVSQSCTWSCFSLFYLYGYFFNKQGANVIQFCIYNVCDVLIHYKAAFTPDSATQCNAITHRLMHMQRAWVICSLLVFCRDSCGTCCG